MHPYEIAQTLRTRAKHESLRLNYGSLYSVVERLEQRGLVRVRESIREGRRPERTIYELTDAGATEMTDWLTDLIASPVKEYLQFEAGLSLLGALPPEDAVAALRQRVGALEWTLAGLRAGLRAAEEMGLTRLLLIESEYHVRLIEAELAFVGEIVDGIDKGSLDGLEEWRGWYREGGAGPPALPAGSERPTTTTEEDRP